MPERPGMEPRAWLLLCSGILRSHPQSRLTEQDWIDLLDPLPDRLKLTVILRYLHDKTEEQIAEFLEIEHRQTIHARIDRAAELLRPRVEEFVGAAR